MFNKKLEQKVDTAILAIGENNKLVNQFLVNLEVAMQSLSKESIKNSGWSKEFHRLLVKELSENQTQGRVYLILYYHPIANVRRPMLAIADNLDNALIIGENSLRRAMEDPKQWVVESNSFIDMPKAPLTLEQISKVDKEISPKAKPAEVFINDIKLMKDKWATTPGEKRALESIIKKIRADYAIVE